VTIASGQSFTVNWQVSGANPIQSRVCYGTSSDPNTLCQQHATVWQSSSPATLSGSIAAPLVTGTAPQTIYFVVQAQAGAQTVFSMVVQSSDSGTTIGPPSFPSWVYDSTISSNLRGLTIRLEKHPIGVSPGGGSLQQYHIYVVRTDGYYVNGAYLTMVLNKAMFVDHTSYQQQTSPAYYDNLLRNLGDSSYWHTATVADPNASTYGRIAIDVLGFIPLEVAGYATSTLSLLDDIRVLLPDVAPDTAFVSKEQEDNTYTTRHFYIDQQSLWGTEGLHFVFSVQEDAAGANQPDLYLRVGLGGEVVGVQINASDRNAPSVDRKVN
jgi:hypothetical protein